MQLWFDIDENVNRKLELVRNASGKRNVKQNNKSYKSSEYHSKWQTCASRCELLITKVMYAHNNETVVSTVCCFQLILTTVTHDICTQHGSAMCHADTGLSFPVPYQGRRHSLLCNLRRAGQGTAARGLLSFVRSLVVVNGTLHFVLCTRSLFALWIIDKGIKHTELTAKSLT